MKTVASSTKIMRDSFVAGALAVVALVMFIAMVAKPNWYAPALYFVLFIVWAFVSWGFYKVELGTESKRAIIDAMQRE
jgi:mannose/fructose/N-acetylgalactosamine-specific phosphotransferase system component IID